MLLYSPNVNVGKAGFAYARGCGDAHGMFNCCGQKLFTSESKFDSGCGWPAFDREIEKGTVEYEEDYAFGMRRTEILCSNCGGHLGHVFDDGPTETGNRFCVNSASLKFEK